MSSASQKQIYNIISQFTEYFESSFGPHGKIHVLIPKREENLVKNVKEKLKLCTESIQLIQVKRLCLFLGDECISSVREIDFTASAAIFKGEW
jgi:hypothetical protein